MTLATLAAVLVLASATALLGPREAAAQEETPPPAEAQDEPAEAEAEPAEPERRNRVLWYVPNRLFDILDVFRVRARIGPGLAADARVTVAEVFVGGYASGYVGLPGPRLERKRPRLLGPEAESGVKVLFGGSTTATENGPGYSPTEVGAGVHLGILGVDLGADFFEVIDLLGGFLLLDPRKDDL
jgi:hypothetical protein